MYSWLSDPGKLGKHFLWERMLDFECNIRKRENCMDISGSKIQAG